MAIRSRMSKKTSNKKRFQRFILFFLMVATVVALFIAYTLFQFILKPNVRTADELPVSLYIPGGATFADVKDLLYSKELIINLRSFEWVAGRKNYPASIKPGHYVLTSSMNNNELLNMLRAGLQTPVKVVFNNIRKKEELASKISRQLEADSASLMRCWNDVDFLSTLNTTPERALTIFIPNTYEFWWTADAYEFTKRIHQEYLVFWNSERTHKAESIGLSIHEVIILASIVEKETRKNDEKAEIAGVYINRLKKGWPLQADPTVVYATGNFDLNRVLKVHTKIDSPYNTYKNKGLPPGPICMPTIASIDAVLDYEKHSYMFFCARADLSGYHAFSRTLAEHNRYAKAYQKAIKGRR